MKGYEIKKGRFLWYSGFLSLAFLFTAPNTAVTQSPQMELPDLAPTGSTFLALRVADDEEAAGWYGQVLGVEQVSHTLSEDEKVSIRLLSGEGFTVELIRDEGLSNSAGPHLGLFKVGFFVDNIQDAYRRFRRLGVDMDERIVIDRVLEVRTFVLRDPEGNRLQVFERCTSPCM